MYDQVGLEYMMRGGPAPEPGGGGASPFEGGMPGGFGFGGMPGGGTRTFHFTSGPGGGGGFRFSSADDIFSNFAKSGGGGMGGDFDDDDFFSSFFGGGGFGPGAGARTARAGGGGGGGFGQQRRTANVEPTAVEKELSVSLEEIFKGANKKFTIKSKKIDAGGRVNIQNLTLEANIKPGLRGGSKMKFRDIGDHEGGGKEDLHLLIKEVSP